MRVAIIGKDTRQRAVGEAFAARSHEVIWGVDLSVAAEIWVLPMPISEDGRTLFGTELLLSDVFAALAGKTVYGGRCSEAVANLAAEHNVRLMDHFAREEETVLNVIPTVEGALQICFEQTDFTLHGANVLVLGFGRIGKLLSHHLKALGANLTVFARKSADLAWCSALGYQSSHFERLADFVGGAQVIFNTVPHVVLTHEILSDTNALVIDLASAPGGVDEAASALGKNVIKALALPVKVAPRTAGDIICKTILNMYKEENTRVR